MDGTGTSNLSTAGQSPRLKKLPAANLFTEDAQIVDVESASNTATFGQNPLPSRSNQDYGVSKTHVAPKQKDKKPAETVQKGFEAMLAEEPPKKKQRK